MAREIAPGITVDPDVMVGKPVIEDPRMPVDLVIAKLAANPDLDEFLADYPHLTLEQVKACATRRRSWNKPPARTAQGLPRHDEVPARRGHRSQAGPGLVWAGSSWWTLRAFGSPAR
jgi:uncharacterized protein (DUF433 family)